MEELLGECESMSSPVGLDILHSSVLDRERSKIQKAAAEEGEAVESTRKARS